MSKVDKKKSRKTEIMIAIIGLIGVLATAVFSNWDKIFLDQEILQASIKGYRATGIFETELRYYFEVSGTRAAIENMVQQMVNNMKMSLIMAHPEDAEEIDTTTKVVLEECITTDEVIKKFLPVYRKHFTVEELQELNKFYSTEIM